MPALFSTVLVWLVQGFLVENVICTQAFFKMYSLLCAFNLEFHFGTVTMCVSVSVRCISSEEKMHTQ